MNLANRILNEFSEFAIIVYKITKKQIMSQFLLSLSKRLSESKVNSYLKLWTSMFQKSLHDAKLIASLISFKGKNHNSETLGGDYPG